MVMAHKCLIILDPGCCKPRAKKIPWELEFPVNFRGDGQVRVSAAPEALLSVRTRGRGHVFYFKHQTWLLLIPSAAAAKAPTSHH